MPCGYSGATEGVPSYRVMPRDGGERQWISDKARRKAALGAKARQLFGGHRHAYGYRGLPDALGKAGMESGHYQVRHLMARLGLKARYPKRFKVTADSGHSGATPPNRLGRQFDVVAPNQVWTTDITYVWTPEGWL